jgi:hypothetical protein
MSKNQISDYYIMPNKSLINSLYYYDEYKLLLFSEMNNFKARLLNV